MSKEYIMNQYFCWLCELILPYETSHEPAYNKLLNYLFNKQFNYILDMDGNRACDGVELRYRFGDVYGYHQAEIANALDDRPCSILEMMVALSVICEESIMNDPDVGDMTHKWFWEMIENLGLIGMDDKNFNIHYVDAVITRFLNRDYLPDGRGGLFKITSHSDEDDLRNVDIWYQMMRHLNEILYLKGD